jgi:hypothetical protein
MKAFYLSTFLLILLLLSACRDKTEYKEFKEEIRLNNEQNASPDSLWNAVSGDITMQQIASFPSRVILTGLPQHRLVNIYRSIIRKIETDKGPKYEYRDYGYSHGGEDSYSHYMPGIDILYGYNLLNISHYDLKSNKSNFLFDHPVLVKTLYYPSEEPDSVDSKPINRNFYLVSVYDEDTNKDSIINSKDLRRFYHFDSSGTVKTQLIPPAYSAVHSQYDPQNDVMYIFTKHDKNKNGKRENEEPIHIFWFSLKAPEPAKLLY